MRKYLVDNQIVEQISVETVRSHLKKAQAKLAARTLPHAVALGMRQRLFP